MIVELNTSVVTYGPHNGIIVRSGVYRGRNNGPLNPPYTNNAEDPSLPAIQFSPTPLNVDEDSSAILDEYKRSTQPPPSPSYSFGTNDSPPHDPFETEKVNLNIFQNPLEEHLNKAYNSIYACSEPSNADLKQTKNAESYGSSYIPQQLNEYEEYTYPVRTTNWRSDSDSRFTDQPTTSNQGRGILRIEFPTKNNRDKEKSSLKAKIATLSSDKFYHNGDNLGDKREKKTHVDFGEVVESDVYQFDTDDQYNDEDFCPIPATRTSIQPRLSARYENGNLRSDNHKLPQSRLVAQIPIKVAIRKEHSIGPEKLHHVDERESIKYHPTVDDERRKVMNSQLGFPNKWNAQKIQEDRDSRHKLFEETFHLYETRDIAGNLWAKL